MRLGAKNYKLVITSAVWKVCCISLNPNMILPHDEDLKISPAIYPFGGVTLRVLVWLKVH